MTVESVTYPRDLNVLYPEDNSARSQIDDHIRNCKTALKTNAWELVGDVTVGSAQIETYTTHPFVANYDYQLVIDGMYFSSTSAAPRLRVTTSGGVEATGGADYSFALVGGGDTSTAVMADASNSFISLTISSGGVGDASTETCRITIEAINPAGTTAGRTMLIAMACRPSTTDFYFVEGGGQYNNTAAADGLSFYINSGTITAANAKLYRRYSP